MRRPGIRFPVKSPANLPRPPTTPRPTTPPTSRAPGAGRGASARSAARPRPGRRQSSRRAARPRSGLRGNPSIRRKPLREGVIRGLKVLMWSALVSVVVVGLGLVLYFTPVMAARVTVITGLSTVSELEVEQAAAIVPGTPLLQIDTDAVAERVATIRRVASARVQREYPSTLRITVAERVPGGRQGLSRRPAPVRSGRGGLRVCAAAPWPAVSWTPTTPARATTRRRRPCRCCLRCGPRCRVR